MSKKKYIILILLVFTSLIYYFTSNNNIFSSLPKSETSQIALTNNKNILDDLSNFKLQANKVILGDNNEKSLGVRYTLSFNSKSLNTNDDIFSMVGFELSYNNQTRISIGKSSSGINYSKLITLNASGMPSYTVDFYEYGSSFSNDIIKQLTTNIKDDIQVKILLKDRSSMVIEDITYQN